MASRKMCSLVTWICVMTGAPPDLPLPLAEKMYRQQKHRNMESSNLEKKNWDETNFQTMQWHDCKIYAIAFDSERFELVLDIDFIVEWIAPKDSQSTYEFWMVPATLAFKNV